MSLRDKYLAPHSEATGVAPQSPTIAVLVMASQRLRCPGVWVHGRPAGGSLGAWYPIVVFEYTSEQ